MPPTIQSSTERRKSDREKIKEGFVCNVKYTNTLPDIPFDAKFITYPFEANRFIQYKPTSLERNNKHELLTEPDLGVTIDLINPETYDIPPDVELDPADEKLLEEEMAPAADQKRQRQHNATVTWMRKTEYISTEYNRFQTSNEMAETKVGYNAQKRKKINNVDLYKDRDSQIEAIEASFEAAKKTITHHETNKRVKPVEILPFFPDFQFWHMPCAHVIFDTEPTQRGKTEPANLSQMSLGMIRGMEDESGDQFVAYFLPTDDTLGKKKEEGGGKEPAENEEYEYKLAREYNWNVKNKAIKGFEENYFFVFRENEGVFYNELQTRVRLNKRRGLGGAGGVSSSVSKLVVKNRDPTENEIRLQNARLVQLENVVQEEDDDDDDADDDSDAELEDILGGDDDDDEVGEGEGEGDGDGDKRDEADDEGAGDGDAGDDGEDGDNEEGDGEGDVDGGDGAESGDGGEEEIMEETEEEEKPEEKEEVKSEEVEKDSDSDLFGSSSSEDE